MLYVEGPRDRDILRSWARRLAPSLARALDSCVVILGGRQPARALEHFSEKAATCPGLRGLCVLDRDGQSGEPVIADAAAGLEFFTWPRRHIESYLLVPAAMRRAAARGSDKFRLERALAEHLPNDESELLTLHAKKLLAPKGAFAREAGSHLKPSDVARRMRVEEIHHDVRALIERLREAVQPDASPPPLVVRKIST